MAIKIIEDLKALRSNSYAASRAIKALEDAYREIDKLESEDLFLRTQLYERDAEIERLEEIIYYNIDNLDDPIHKRIVRKFDKALKGGGE